MKRFLLRVLSAACALPAAPLLASFAQAPATPAPATAPAAATPRPAGFTPTAPHVNAPLGNIPRHLGDGDGAYKTGKYRDLFAENGHPAAETQARLEKSFQQFFHGDAANERVYFEAGSNANGSAVQSGRSLTWKVSYTAPIPGFSGAVRYGDGRESLKKV